MRIALACAARGRGRVEPNPMVGAVLVRGGREIARGGPGRCGGPHAEGEALGAARAAGEDVGGATMYVTLEPCSHHGKTPPCADALVEAGIARVVAAMADPDEKVSGRGFRRLREAGIDVAVGCLTDEARALLAAYCKLRTARRPWVICKWAQTPEGYLALPAGAGRWISGPRSRERVHELRGLCQGVLVGIGTVLVDDPLLTSRGESPPASQPARVVLDGRLRIPLDCQLVRTSGVSPVIVATTSAAVAEKPHAATALRQADVELLELPPAAGGVDAAALLDDLGRREWTYLLVEGGATVLAAFVCGGLADELLVFIAPRAVGGAPDDLPRFDITDVRAELQGRLVEERRCGPDLMLRYRLGPS